MKITEDKLRKIVRKQCIDIIRENRFLNEDLGTFGGAVKNGWLRNDFVVENVKIDQYNGRVCLMCHMGRWFGKDDDIILFSDGTGINTDTNAGDQNFKWKTIRARTTSFAKSILVGAGIGGAAGAVGPAAVKYAKGLAAGAGAAGTGASAAGAGAAGTGASAAGAGAAGTGAAGTGASAAGAGAAGTGASAAGAGAAGTGASAAGVGRLSSLARNVKRMLGNPSKAMTNSDKSRIAQVRNIADRVLAGKTITKSEEKLLQRFNQGETLYEGINEGFVSAGVGAAAGAAAGGLYALYKNRNNIIYYSDGTFKSIKGDIDGRWDVIEGGNESPEGKKGSSGKSDPRVARMQAQLNAFGWAAPKLKEDGILGAKTRRAAELAGINPDTWQVGQHMEQNPNMGGGPSKSQAQGLTVGNGPEPGPIKLSENKLRSIIRHQVIKELRNRI